MEQQPPATPLANNASGAADTRDDLLMPRRDRPRKRNKWVWAVLLTVFAVAVVLILRHKSVVRTSGGSHHHSDAPVTLNASTAHTGQMAVKLLAIGTVTPTYTASITSQVTGQIVSVHYREGQYVAKGAPLIDIDPRPYQATLDTAQGTLERDQGVLAQAQMDLARYQAAWARNAIARQQLDDQSKLVEQDQGLVRSDQGTVESDRVNLAFCHIVAPISGKVGLRLTDPGNVVQANSTTALVVVTAVDPITVVFTIPEDELPPVEAAMRRHSLQVSAYDRNQQTLLATGYLGSIDNQIDTTTGTVKLRATFKNPSMKLFPNQFVNTELLVDVLQNQVLIPSSTIQQNGTQAYVYVLKNGVAKITNIKVVQTDETNSAVTGIASGAMVANSSFEKLQDGSKFRVVTQRVAPTSAESSAP